MHQIIYRKQNKADITNYTWKEAEPVLLHICHCFDFCLGIVGNMFGRDYLGVSGTKVPLTLSKTRLTVKNGLLELLHNYILFIV